MDVALLERLREALGRGPPVKLALLFGSRARGAARPESDVDVGILPLDAAFDSQKEALLCAELEAAAGATVDLVRLDGDDLLLGREAARHGVLLFEAHPGVFARYRAEAITAWLDFEPTFRNAERRFFARIAERRGP